MTETPHWLELSNSNGMVVRLVDVGASIASIRVPVVGKMREVVVGSDTRDDYLSNPAFLGANVGRFANRIAGGQFAIKEQSFQLSINQAPNHLHGAGQLSHSTWQLLQYSAHSAVYEFKSNDGDEGYPGNLQVQVHYELGDDNDLTISYEAHVDKPCPLNLTNHSYFNLDVEHGTVHQHQLKIAADRYLPVRSDGIPEAHLEAVEHTNFDFRTFKAVGAVLLADEQQKRVKGYDHSFMIAPSDNNTPAAQVLSADGKVCLSVYTSKPALHLYTGNYLGGVPTRTGEGVDYQGIALETQFLPDAPNRNWPHQTCILQPSEVYKYATRFQFSV
ncbi:galactose-1-epimerase [Echinimonas agarilytica]|uniref:Aldose 1-epimerase n=1 Tax=Echinimonas agarilytica TaxID=1215918 RepID=A0AA42B8T9_9GAMM|nr:galactose-1-epimerase [Echinimonas agarilytica]MCM2681262.1 galactose-1-epimerase [Echinimonas agarilytica]